MAPASVVRYTRHLYRLICSVVLSSLLPIASASAASYRCAMETDYFVPGDSDLETKFSVSRWVQRGICIRSQGGGKMCYATLKEVLSNLIELRKAEYSGSSGILSLLPTIGALLGAPTNEIWTLMTILPFGGALATSLSFGAAIMPVRIENYEHSIRKDNTSTGSNFTIRPVDGGEEGGASEFEQKIAFLENRVNNRISRSARQAPPKSYLLAGLLGMMLLFLGSQAAMGIVEQGGVLSWWCGCRYWMHLWYLMGMNTNSNALGCLLLRSTNSYRDRGTRELCSGSVSETA